MWKDLWWFLGILLGLFVVWVMLGGPEKARKENLRPIINGPIGNQNSGNSSPNSGEINVVPVN